MKRRMAILMLVLLVGAANGTVWAHVPEAVMYYVFQWPDEFIPTIDGDISEWDIVPEVYWITEENFSEDVKGLGTAWDATDWGVKYIASWNKTTNRMYFMIRIFDDNCHPGDYWECTIDADHSGENQMAWFSDLSEEEAKRLGGAYGQTYKTYPVAPNEARGWIWSFTTAKWILDPEWFEFAVTLDAPLEGEGIYRQEVSAHAWDDLDYHGPDVSDIHIFEEGTIIGMGYQMADNDGNSRGYDGYWTLGGGAPAAQFEYALTDFLLTPIDASVIWPGGLRADFAGSPRNGDAPLTVQFTDASVGDVTTYAWDFGDGRTSPQQHPMHTYTMPGTYMVALTVTDSSGSDTETKTDYITVTGEPALRAWIPSVPAIPGETVEVPLLVDDLTGWGVVSSDILVSYDADVLTGLGVITGGGLLDGIGAGNLQYNITPGQIDIAVTSAPDTVNGGGILLYLLFHVSDGAESGGYSDVALTEVIFNDGVPLVAREDGRVGITELGDVSYNFRVTAYDAALTVLGSVGAIAMPDPVYPNLRLVVADVDGDGDMDAVDGVLMLQYAVGLLSDFPGSLAKVVTTVGLGDVEWMADGTLVVPVLVADMRDVLAGELTLRIRGNGPVRVLQGDGIGGYVFGSYVENGSVRIAFAGVRSGSGMGRVAELHFDPEEGGVGEVELLSVQLNGDDMVLGQRVVEVSDRPGMYVLSQNYPNPFNPGTAIEFEIPESGDVALGIYNMGGQRVRELVVGYRDAGRYKVSWDGRDDVGDEVSAGVYLYELRVNRFSSIKKMTLAR